jgi:hypothetical protein
MPKQGTRAEVNTFVKGLITEASPLNFPANASLDEVNFELLRNGTRRRRKGIQKASASFTASNVASTANNSFVWNSVDGNASLEFVVVQVGNVLSFLNLSNGVSSGSLVATLSLPKFSATKKYSFSTINGNLLVASGATIVYCVAYNGTFTLTERVLKVRDVWGVQESDAGQEADATVQPTVLTETHKYNLQNQSWGIPRKDKVGTPVDPVAYYKADLGKYPSSTETVWNGLQFQPVEVDTTETPGEVNTTSTGSPGTAGGATATTTVDPDTGEYTTTTSVEPGGLGGLITSVARQAAPTKVTNYKDPYERMFNSLYVDRLGADLKAAKGYYIIELLNRGASRLAATNNNHTKFPLIPAATGFKQDYNTYGASLVCEFSGRVFYSGFDGTVVDGDVRSPSLGDYVVFSKLVQSDVDIDLCYQEGDPTSRESSDIVDTDGGFISISGAKNIIALRNLGAKLLVFASNGVWSIAGGNDYGFTATNYKVDKLTSFGCLSPESIVVEGSNLLYWGKSAIYAITPDTVGGFQVQDVTAESIQTFYDKIPDAAKQSCQGIYHPVEKKIRWAYRTGLFSTSADSNELVFDTVLKSFYRHKIGQLSDYSAQVVGIHYSENTGAKYLVANSNNTFTFATYADSTFADWGVVDAKAYVLTGALTASDSAIDKQIPYVTVHMQRTETGTDSNGVPLNQSSCKMSGRWEWANTVASHKISGLYEVYKYRMPLFSLPNSTFDNGFETVISKNKVRGRGKAISLYFETSPGKDCVLLGWSITLNGNGVT